MGSPAPGLPTVDVADRLSWLGHSTVFVELDGTRVLTDPLLRRRVFHLRRVSKVTPQDLGALDGVLVSHVHYDHLDLPSLRRLPATRRSWCPEGPGLLGGGRDVLVEAAVGDEIPLGNIVVHAVHAVHTSRRALGTKTEPLGYVIAGSKRVYFPGDTDLFPGMADLAPVDVALVPIWGWGPTLGPGHLDPRTAAEALRVIRPRIAVPIHGARTTRAWARGRSGRSSRRPRRPSPRPPPSSPPRSRSGSCRSVGRCRCSDQPPQSVPGGFWVLS